MRIVGIGMDATDIPRIAAAIERFGDRFLTRILTEHELAYCRGAGTPRSMSPGRFAPKEAGMKAIGTGHSRGVLWREIEVVRHDGPPTLRFHGAALRHFQALGATRALLTITHSDTLALAHVILTAD
jgi:holo-[acyl-carrier protein] synthase